MARGAMRSALTACFGLVVLQKLTTTTGSSHVAGAIDAVNSIVKRAFDPNVAAIPDLAGAGAPSERAPLPSPTEPAPSSSVPPNPDRIPLYHFPS